MPIVDPEIINSGEKELYASIIASFDEFQIEKLFIETHNFNIQNRELTFQFHIFLLAAYTRYCGYGIWYKTGDFWYSPTYSINKPT